MKDGSKDVTGKIHIPNLSDEHTDVADVDVSKEISNKTQLQNIAHTRLVLVQVVFVNMKRQSCNETSKCELYSVIVKKSREREGLQLYTCKQVVC